jgi:carbamoyl-phosphate synthase large subunit
VFTCAGQRAEIIRAFSCAGGRTIAADSSPLAPALYHADAAVQVPRWHEPGYIDALRAIVSEHGVGLILPLTDLDSRLLARERTRLGALVLLPKAEIVDRSIDKLTTYEFLVAQGIGSPRTWHPDELPRQPPYPLFLKLRYGSAAKGVATVRDSRELAVLLARMEQEPIVQELCEGREFSLDVFGDLEARCVNSIPRTMIESKGGESIKGSTLGDLELIAFGQRVAEAFGVVGPATIQCFREADGRLLVTDINLRFGGAFPLPTAAGSRYPEYALALARGEPVEARVGEFERDVVLSCYPTQVILRRGAEGVKLAAA